MIHDSDQQGQVSVDGWRLKPSELHGGRHRVSQLSGHLVAELAVCPLSEPVSASHVILPRSRLCTPLEVAGGCFEEQPLVLDVASPGLGLQVVMDLLG